MKLAKGRLSQMWRRVPHIPSEYYVGAAGLVVMNAIFLAEAFRGNAINQTSAGLLGDFIGGYVGTGFALISVLLLFRTLKMQQSLSAPVEL